LRSRKKSGHKRTPRIPTRPRKDSGVGGRKGRHLDSGTRQRKKRKEKGHENTPSPFWGGGKPTHRGTEPTTVGIREHCLGQVEKIQEPKQDTQLKRSRHSGRKGVAQRQGGEKERPKLFPHGEGGKALISQRKKFQQLRTPPGGGSEPRRLPRGGGGQTREVLFPSQKKNQKWGGSTIGGRKKQKKRSPRA